jgi:type II secretion system protein G
MEVDRMRSHGFTLIELIVVIAIIAILAAVIAPQAFVAIEKSKVAKAYTDFKGIKAGCLSLNADTGNWPHGYNSAVQVHNSDIMVDASNWTNWNGPYLDGFKGNTPWRGTYFFTTNADMGRGAQFELAIEFENRCFPNGPNGGCPIPLTSTDKIDANLDDGNRSTGDVQIVPWADLHWALVWDLCPASSCW